MSVDRVSPLSPSPVDPAGARSGGYSRPAPSSANTPPDSTRAFSSPLATIQETEAIASGQSLPSTYYNLSLSALAAISIKDDESSQRGVSGGALASSAYAAIGAPERDRSELIAGRLPQETIARLTLASLQENATAQHKPLIHALQTLAIADPARSPSQNDANAQFAQKTSFVVNDKFGNQTTLDFYLTRTGLNSWEVAAYDRQDASMSGGFPYASAPLLVDRLAIDPATGQIMASVVGQILFTKQNSELPHGQATLLALASFIFLASTIGALVVINQGHALTAFAIAAAGAYGAMLAARSKWPF